MSEQGVKKIVGRMIADDEFRKSFYADPQKAINESGYQLDQNEIAAISKIKPDDLTVNYQRPSGQGGVVATLEVGAVKL